MKLKFWPLKVWVQDPWWLQSALEMNNRTTMETKTNTNQWKDQVTNSWAIGERERERVSLLTVKPNWIGPKATMRTQAKTDIELSRMTWEEPIILDCLEPIRYQLPVCKNGLRRFWSSLSSLKLIFSWKRGQLTKLEDVCEEELKFTVPVRTRATYELISHALKYLYLYVAD